MFKLEPVFKDYIWGGKRLKNDFNKKSELDTIAESWELCCHKNGTNKIVGKDMLLNEYLLRNKQALGSNCDKFSNFPILIKLIDAKDNLSIQVHPDDNYAKEHENSFGKTEMWYVIDCEPDAYLYYGFNRKISKEEIINRINQNDLLEVLNRVPIKKGDVFFIPSGTIHAICKGILIAEIQQNSDVTYRVYDYNRVGKDGKPRELHVKKAIDILNLDVTMANGIKVIEENRQVKRSIISSCSLFEVQKILLNGHMAFNTDGKTFFSFLCIDGKFTINDLDVKKGDSIFIEANFGKCDIIGEGEFLLTFIP